MMKQLIIDRFEQNFALCEDKEKHMFAIEKTELPAGAKEGDVLRISEEGQLTIDQQETQRRRNVTQKKQSKL